MRPELSFRDLVERVGRGADGYVLHDGAADDAADDAAVMLEGDFSISEFRSGLNIHVTDAFERRDLSTVITVRPAVTVSVIVEGTINATLDGQPVLSGGTGVRGKIWCATRPATLERAVRRGELVRKVNISVSPNWLRAYATEEGQMPPALQRFSTRHLAMVDWTPGPASIRRAEDILAEHGDARMLSRLALEIRALGILREAFSLFGLADDPAAPEAGADPRDMVRARRVHDFIDAHISDPLSLAAIAGATGMSLSTLQRVFKAAYGVTVVEHLRIRRLERAREALLGEGLSIQQAAHLAGYTSAANFATAFKRLFGYPPSHCAG